MLSIGRIGAGDGYRYLTDQVATQDAPRAGEALLGYYERTGYPPGVWLGAQAEAFGLRGPPGLGGPPGGDRLPWPDADRAYRL